MGQEEVRWQRSEVAVLVVGWCSPPCAQHLLLSTQQMPDAASPLPLQTMMKEGSQTCRDTSARCCLVCAVEGTTAS